jgi:hypothetical protein
MPNPLKIRAVVEFHVPMSITNVCAFLGLTNCCQNYIKGYAKIVYPLFALTRKDVNFRWVPIYQGVFETLKKALVEVVIFYRPDFNKT